MKGITEESIVQAAAEILNEQGEDALSLKGLAQKLGIKAPSLYNHVDSLEDVKKRVMLYGWARLEERMVRATMGIAGYDALKSLCNAFYDYVESNRGVFGVMMRYNKYRNEEIRRSTERLQQQLQVIAGPVGIPAEDCGHLVRMIRSFLEGFFMITNNEEMRQDETVRESFAFSLEVLVEGLRTVAAHGTEEIPPVRDNER